MGQSPTFPVCFAGNLQSSRRLICQVILAYPGLLQATAQLVALERRQGNENEVVSIYELALTEAKGQPELHSWLAMKYARFLFKILNKPDKALLILRGALKLNKTNVALYRHIMDICYQRSPVDSVGVLASVQVALRSKELAPEQKLDFARRKQQFLEEFGAGIKECRAASEDVAKYERECLKQPAKVRSRQIQVKTGELEPLPSEQSVCNVANTYMESAMLIAPNYALTNEEYYYDGQQLGCAYLPPQTWDQTEAPVETKESYRMVPPPTTEIDSSVRKDPFYEWYETMKHNQYDALRTQGYGGDTNAKPVEEILCTACKKVITKEEQLVEDSTAAVSQDGVACEPVVEEVKDETKACDEVQIPQAAVDGLPPCINIPEWFVREGGELCLSQTRSGMAVLRYWPYFLSECGNNQLLETLRSSINWEKRKYLQNGKWMTLPHLTAWLGPCSYSMEGICYSRNEKWLPELLNLIHRLIQLTQFQFNSCLLMYCQNGQDYVGSMQERHPALGRNPAMAFVSIGAIRTIEFQRLGGHGFLRFPLFPGSLLLMTDAVKRDWEYQIPKDLALKDGSAHLSFRILYDLNN